jgi:hypothetical protein
MPLNSGFVVSSDEETTRLLEKSQLDPSHVRSVALVNNGILSDADGLAAVFRQQYRRNGTLEDVILTPDRLGELATRYMVAARKENVSLSHWHTMVQRDDGFLEVRRIR